MSARRTDLMTTRQLAKALGVSESSVKRWIDEGTIAADRTAGGHRRIPLDAAMRFMRTHRVMPVASAEGPSIVSLAPGPVDSASAESFRKALEGDDLASARGIIAGRYLSGADLAAIADTYIKPSLESIGEMWACRSATGDMSAVLIEHRAVDQCATMLREIQAWLPALPAGAPTAVVSGCPEDPYLLPPMLAFLTLRERGIDARNLGPQTPFDTILAAVKRYTAGLCAISVSAPLSRQFRSELSDLATQLSRLGARLVLGGRCVEQVPSLDPSMVAICRGMTELGAYATGRRHAGSARPPF